MSENLRFHPQNRYTEQSIPQGIHKTYQHMKRGQSLNDFELNQKPYLINQPYCKHIIQETCRDRKVKATVQS